MDHVKNRYWLAASLLLILCNGCGLGELISGGPNLEEQLQKLKMANAAPAPGIRDVAMERLLTPKAQALVDAKFEPGDFKGSYLYATQAAWAARRGYKVFKDAKGNVIGQGNDIVVNGRTIEAVFIGRSKRGTCAAITFKINQPWDGTAWGDYELDWSGKIEPDMGPTRIPCRNK